MSTPVRTTRLPEFCSSQALASRGLGDSRFALGLAGLGGAWGPVDEGRSRATVEQALELGIGAVDTAPSYQAAEKLLGRALDQWRGPRPIISTKVGRARGNDPHDIRYDFSPRGMRESVQRSLETLRVDRIDLLFLHEPQLVPLDERERVVDTMRKIQADGLALRLGFAGGHGEGWNVFLESKVFDVVMLFRRVDPVIFDGLAEDCPRIRQANMSIYGASPLHMGLLGARYDEFHRERPAWVWKSQIDRAAQLKTLAEDNGLTLPTLAHRFMFGMAELDRVVIGASNEKELQSALEDFKAGPLSTALFDEICDLHSEE